MISFKEFLALQEALLNEQDDEDHFDSIHGSLEGFNHNSPKENYHYWSKLGNHHDALEKMAKHFEWKGFERRDSKIGDGRKSLTKKITLKKGKHEISAETSLSSNRPQYNKSSVTYTKHPDKEDGPKTVIPGSSFIRPKGSRRSRIR